MATLGATAAVLCDIGTYQDQDGQSNCKPAPSGHYVHTEGAWAADSCPRGTYQDQAGQSNCKPAPAGSYVANKGATAPNLCLAANREYQDQEGQPSCKSAGDLGTVAHDGATEPLCTVGYYYSQSGEFPCLPCPDGTPCEYSGVEFSTPIAPTATP